MAQDRRRSLGVGLAGFTAFLELYATQGMLPFLAKELHVSAVAASTTVSATTTAVALSAPFAGMLSDRYGRERVIRVAACLLVLSTFLAATAATLPMLVVWRAVQGLLLPAIFAPTLAYVGEECSGNVGRTMASYVAGNIVGGVIGRFVMALAAERWGYREAFLVLGCFSFAATFALMLVLPRGQHFVPEPSLGSTLAALLKQLKNSKLWAGYAVGFNILFSIVGVFTYVGFHLAAPPFELGTAALGAVFLVYLTGLVATPLAGRFLDRTGPRVVLLCALAIAASGVLLTLVPSLTIVLVGLGLCAGGIFASQSAANSYLAKSSARARSSAAGLYVSLYYLGGTAGAFVPGVAMRAAGWAGCVTVIVAMQVWTALIAGLLWRKRRRGTVTPQLRPSTAR